MLVRNRFVTLEGVATCARSVLGWDVRPAVLFVLAISISGCGGRPFNVKPRPDKTNHEYRASGHVEGVAIRAQALTDEDYLYETFDANLILAGIYPVRLELKNTGSESLEFKRARFELRSAAGRRFSAVNARKAYKNLISYYGVSIYSKTGNQRALEDFSSHSLNIDGKFEAGESRQGLLFFDAPADAFNGGSVTLSAARLPGGESIELKLD
jgi:hypothetical protein